MSHTIGQAQTGNQPSNADRDSSSPEDKTSQSVSQLSDSDYEFLFSQLLEGVAHGWHDRRIIKFFQQLGDRGKSEDWVAWLERKRSKLILLPVQSKRQLGTVMVRLGEITQSALEVKEIGTASNRIGRELLFGNTEDLVWEYAGPDLIVEATEIELETEDKLSERLPEDFAELGSNPIAEVETDLSLEEISTEESVLPESSTEDLLEKTSISEVEEFPFTEMLEEPSNTETEKESEKNDEPEIASDVSETTSTTLELEEVKDISQTNDSDAFNSYSEEFEFELEAEPELATEDLIPTPEKVEPVDISMVATESEPLEIESSQEIDSKNSQSTEITELTESDDKDPTAIDVEQLIDLIQEDDRLAQEISEKLNLSTSKSDDVVVQTSNSSSLATPMDLDRSSIDLIEGWFNLGLKQVSGGEFDNAIASWEKALNINPNLSEAWHNRGSALGRLGRYQEAVESFQRALSIDSANYQAWNDRAHALYQMQHWLAAAESWSNALKITPGNHLFWYNRGCALEQLENWAESIVSYEKSLEIKPDFQPARIRYTNLVADNSRSN